MKKSTAVAIISILAVLAIVMCLLFVNVNGQKSTLATDVENRKNEITELNAQIAGLKGNVQEQEGAISAMQSDAAARDTEIETLKGSVTDKDAELEALKGSITDKDAELEALQGSITAKDAELETLKGSVTDKDAEISRLSADLGEKDGQFQALNEKYNQARKNAITLKYERDNARIEADAARKRTAQLQSDIAALTVEPAPAPAPAPVSGESIDFAEVFPSWNPDSASLQALVAFVSDSVDESSPNYLDPADRIATFDMDGTIICEKAPVYVDYCLTMYRVLDDPSYSATEEERAAMQQIRDHAYAFGETYNPETLTKDEIVASAFAGMTPADFRAYVVDFVDRTPAVGFEGMTYGESFYKPMIEVINYLRANGYDVWMVSACEREVVRALVQRWNIPFDHCVATDVAYIASGNDAGTANDKYDMTQAETLVLGTPLDEVECAKSGKPAAIAREIGKRPVLAFGNSSGDYSMLNYAKGNPDHPGMGIFIVCDDTEREYGSDEKAAGFYAKVEEEGWTAFSMKNDWKIIYGEDVKKTELPGAAEEALPDAA